MFQLFVETKETLPKLPFEAVKNAALGEEYELNVVIVSAERMKKLNTIYRDKTEATDILSFPLNETSGEIFMCLSKAKKEAPKFERDFENFLAFLFIHGCVHLKGYDHGATMETKEVELRKKFGI